MKLYLTSYRIPLPQILAALIGKTPADTRVAILPNAGDYYAERPRQIRREDTVDYFAGLGYTQTRIVDLAAFSNAEELKAELADTDLIWANGGNTFMLMHQMRRSGFAEIIKELITDGVVYGGESAGAIVAGTDLKGVEYADDPRFVDEEITEGLRLVDSFVLPHVGSPMFADSMDKAKAEHKDQPIIELTDSQVYVMDGKKTEILTGDKSEG